VNHQEKFELEFVVNLKNVGLHPQTLLATADEVIH
jgi:hypothetical protein